MTTPASVPGSPKYLANAIADGVAIVSRLGPVTYFITMTANPKCAYPRVPL